MTPNVSSTRRIDFLVTKDTTSFNWMSFISYTVWFVLSNSLMCFLRLKYTSQNMLRKGLHPEYYPEMRNGSSSNLEDPHWRYCLESIRQSLMCSADISPLVWQWVDRLKEVRIMGNIIHTCRNYDKIKEWAFERRVQHPLDFSGSM